MTTFGSRVAGRRIRRRRHHGIPEHILRARSAPWSTESRRRRSPTGMRYADKIQQSHCRHVMAGGGSACSNGPADAGTRPVAPGQPGAGEPGLHAGGALAWRGGARVRGVRTRGVRPGPVVARECIDARRDPSGAIDLILPALWGLAETELHSGNVGSRPRNDVPMRSSARSRSANRPCSLPSSVTGCGGPSWQPAAPTPPTRWAEIGRRPHPGTGHRTLRPAVRPRDRASSKLSAGSTRVLPARRLRPRFYGWD